MKLFHFLPFLIMLSSTSCVRSPEKPNIILIMADDMGYSDIGCYGGEVNTPNINRLAEEGVIFSQFYNSARCCPTRAALLTGLYPHQAGLGHMVDGVVRDGGYYGELNNSSLTIAEVLSASGYSTYMSGKWHVSRSVLPGDKHNWPMQRGFQRFFGTITGAGSFYDPATLTSMNTPIKAGKGFYYTDAISDTAVVYIKDHIETKEKKPFFLYVAYTAPHWPLHAPESEIEKYEDIYLQGWDKLRQDRFTKMKKLDIINEQITLSDRHEGIADWSDVDNKEWQARRMAVYAAQIDIMDQGIGRIVSILEHNEELDNTLILFLADNGGCAEDWDSETEWIRRYAPKVNHNGEPLQFGNNPDIVPGPDNTYSSYTKEWANLSNTPFRWFKHYGHEGGVATPFIMHWPEGIEAQQDIRRQVSGVIDILPTILSVSGAKYPEMHNGNNITPVAGISLIDAARFNLDLDRDSYFFEHEWNRSIRKGKWKLVALWDGDWELYNMETDRTETENLAIEYPDIVITLAEEWEGWAWRTGVLPRPKD